MRSLSAQELLGVWERGLRQRPGEWALTLLAAANPDTPRKVLEGLSAGQRDGTLLTLREWTFGPHLDSVVSCPACGERLELTFDLADVRVVSPPDSPPEAGERVPETRGLSLDVAGYDVRFRLPNSGDLAAVANEADADVARHLLLERCLLAIRAPREGSSGGPLPPEVAEAVVGRMAKADPQADVQLALACPACGHAWQAPFDIVSFFWREVDAWARRTLYDVHRLALAYGWAEAEILSMDPWRRQVYLDMLGG